MKTRQAAVTTDTVDHFSTIAFRYNDLRTTDPEVVDFVTDVLPAHRHLRAVDVGLRQWPLRYRASETSRQ